MTLRIFFAAMAIMVLPQTVLAADGTQIPEASSSVLFALGVVGVLVGRHASRRKGGGKDRRE